MASVPVLLQRVRRARRESKQSGPTGQFEQYRSDYEQIFRAVDDCAGEDPLDELGAWTVEWTEREGRLPDPATVRRQAREICDRRGAEVPEGSELRE